MAPTTDHALPTFNHPPLVESVLGVQFAPIMYFTSGHAGKFWRSLGPDWTSARDAAPLDPSFEEFGERGAWAEQVNRFRISAAPAHSRLQIQHSSGDRMIQVQESRFHYNWVRKDSAAYPRYATIRPEFEQAFTEFCGFCENEKLTVPAPNQWEITYVNLLLERESWRTAADWSEILPSLLGPATKIHDLGLETLHGRWTFELPSQSGRLHVELACVRAGPDKKRALQLTLTSRGPAADWSAALGGLELGHAAIVRTFDAVTSERAHKLWERVD
jgi:uncharacterized protein (TIGR04255 family)